MDELVDRVAAEIRRQCGKSTDKPWEELSALAKKRWRKRAPAVIATMCEPTEAMMLSAAKKSGASPGIAAVIWRAMIDALRPVQGAG